MTSPSTPTTTPPLVDLSNIQWDDVLVDIDGKATGALGVRWDEFSSKQLRTICSRLGIKEVKNAKKSDMVERLVELYNNKKAYSTLQRREGIIDNPQQKQVQCVFCLMNVLFSDEFATDFAHIGNIADRQVLDSGKASNDEHFWTKVQLAFIEPDDNYDKMRILDDDILADQIHINPSGIVLHDWEKLHSIWKSVNADYKAAADQFTQPGTHDHNFFNYCNGKLDVNYLQKNLKLKPYLNNVVVAELPEECALSSGMVCDARSSSACFA